MSASEPTGRLATWNGRQPDIRLWSDGEVIDALAQLGITTDQTAFETQAKATTSQADMENAWLETSGVTDDQHSVFVWMSVRDLWERWSSSVWPKDRLARMFAYLVDPDFAAEWVDQFHAPTAMAVLDALEQRLVTEGGGKEALDELVETLGMPAVAWPGKVLDSMAEWSEVGNITLVERAAELMSKVLGTGDKHSYMAAAFISARMYDRAKNSALQVDNEAELAAGFDEMVAYLCLAADDPLSARTWLETADKNSGIQAGEMTFAAETVRKFLGEAQDNEVPDMMKKAALQAASQACFYAFMAFAATVEPD
jgi:hypothetical protein